MRAVVASMALLVLAACAPDPSAAERRTAAGGARRPSSCRPSARRRSRSGSQHPTAAELYAALKARANGGAPLSLDDMPDWTGLWQRVGRPFFDTDQPADVLTSAKLKPEPLAELTRRRELSAQGIEYDPISDCGPPGFPRWLAIPFLRELIVTPGQTYLFSETVNNLRRVYTDGRDHPPPADAYPLDYGDSIGFWSGHTLVIHTSQVKAGIYHRNDPQYSESLEAVEVWRKTDPETVRRRRLDLRPRDARRAVVSCSTRTSKCRIPTEYLRIGYWHCGENPNNTVEQTSDGTSQFSDFTFTEQDNR